MKKIALLIVLLLSITNVFSQDKKAKTLLNQVTAKIKSYENIAIDFKYTLNNAKENINQDSKGSVIIKGNQYVLNLMGVIKMFDGKKIYTIRFGKVTKTS